MSTTLTYGLTAPDNGDFGSVWFPAVRANFVQLDAHDHNGTNSAQLSNTGIATGAAIARSKLASGTADHVLINSGAGVMSSEATLAKSRGGSGQDNTSLIFPSSGTLATLAGTEVLTNKDFDGGTASNAKRITFPKDTLANITALTRKEGTVWYASDTDKLYKDDGTSLTEIGSGSSGSINYVLNPDAESAVTGWAAYADAAGTSPVDGTGGSPTVTVTRTTSSPLRGTGSFLITKDASNRQGEGVSYTFTIDTADQAKVLNVSFDYSIASGTFASGDSSDIRVWVYDVTNSVLIPVTPYTIQGGSGNNWKFQGVFQTASSSTSYRLILHVATTSASAYTFKFDNVVVGPQIQLYGAPINDWTSYTPSFVGFGTVGSISAFYRRVGDSLHVIASFTTGTHTAVVASLSLPTGLSIDTAKIQANTTSNPGQEAGQYVQNANANQAGAIVTAVSTSALLVYFADVYTGTAKLVPQLGNNVISNNSVVSVMFTVPISGWSSTVLMSNDTDTRVVAMRASGNPASATSGNPIIFPTTDYDTHGSYNSSTGRYTAPVSGFYQVHGYIQSTTNNIGIHVYVDAADTLLAARTDSNGECAFSATVKVTAGQIIDIRPDGTVDDETNTFLCIERVSGPSAIAATEKIYLQYTGNAGGAQTAGTTNTDFTTKVVDTHGAWSGTVFTAPRAGWYIMDGATTITATVNTNWNLYKNGSSILSRVDATDAKANHFFNYSIYLLAGETLSIRPANNCTLSNSATQHFISIYSQG